MAVTSVTGLSVEDLFLAIVAALPIIIVAPGLRRIPTIVGAAPLRDAALEDLRTYDLGLSQIAGLVSLLHLL